MTALRAVVVDDEPLARERIRTLLAGDQAFELVAECGDGAAALEAITIHSPDLLFLDVQMPEMDGFAVLQSLPTESLPAIVFVTAYDEYAFKAFEVNAVDYLLKPLEPERFQAALQRVRERLDRRGTAEAEPELRALLAQLRSERPAPVRIVVREGERLFFVRAEEVDWIDAQGNYARLHAKGKTHLVRETMKSLEARLDPTTFVRIHRSVIVNVDRIGSLEPYFHGEYVVTMKDGTKFTSSRSHSERLRSLLR
jgi:two-component system, LytTR family, response regulator